MSNAFATFLTDVRPRIDDALDRALPSTSTRPERLHAAMRYSVFAGGKRVRPALVLLGGEALGVPWERLLPAAAAVEMVHTYSLIHDDLPALDDDDLRRGRATLHREYDEATAILAGDALLTLGLTLLGTEPAHVSPTVRSRAVAVVGGAIGSTGMIGGQIDDLEAENDWPDDPLAAGRLLEAIHRRKTGALIAVCLTLAGVYAEVGTNAHTQLSNLGHALGLMFQIRDDMIDVEGSDGTLGKTAGKDAVAKKLTYPGLYGLDETRRLLARTAETARAAAASLPGNRALLGSLIEFLSTRDR